MITKTTGIIRRDLRLIAGIVKNNSRVLDVGCGEGELLDYLDKNKRLDFLQGFHFYFF